MPICHDLRTNNDSCTSACMVTGSYINKLYIVHLFLTGRSSSNGELTSTLSGSYENLVDDNSSDDEKLLIPTEESHDTEQLWLMAITTSIAQGLPHEAPKVLANEEISQTSNPYCDEEEVQEEPLLLAGFLDITDPINHTSQQVINIYQ